MGSVIEHQAVQRSGIYSQTLDRLVAGCHVVEIKISVVWNDDEAGDNRKFRITN